MKKRIFGILFAFALVLALGFSLVTAVPVVAQDSYYVATTGSDAFGNGTETWVDNDSSGDWSAGDTGPWLTIQHAIDTAANGDTINVAAGTYDEALNLKSKTLTIDGAGVDVTIVDASAETGYAVKNFGNSTTIKDLTLIGTNDYGFKVSHVSNITFDSVKVEDSGKTAFDLNTIDTATLTDIEAVDTTAGFGVMILDSNNVTVTNVSTSGNAWGGVSVQTAGASSDSITFSGNFDAQEDAPLLLEKDPPTYYDITNVTIPSKLTHIDYAFRVEDDYQQWFYQETLGDAKAFAQALMDSITFTYSDMLIYDIAAENYYVIEGMLIKDAIDAASGTTIHVDTGEYAGAVVDKSVNLVGASDGSSVITSGVQYKVGGPAYTTAFRLDSGADGAEIRNFTINNSQPANFYFAVFSSGIDNVTIDNLAVNDTVQGISNWGGSDWVITNNTVTDTVAAGGGGIGIFLGAKPVNDLSPTPYPVCSNNLVQYNEINATATAEGYSCPGICLCLDLRHNGYLNTDNTEDVTGNQILDNTITAAGANNGIGIEVGTILGNSETDPVRNDPAEIAKVMAAAAVHDNLVQDNTTDGADTGIYFYNVTDLTVTLNTIENSVSDGIYAEHAENGTTITGNTFSNNEVQVKDDTGTLNIAGIFASNTFDRAVTVDHPGASLLPTIWSKIQDGIDNAVADDTVNVGAGTYDEQVVITQGLTLQGAGDTTIIQPSQTTADAFQLFERKTTGSGNDSAPIVVATTSGATVNIKNLKIDGSLVGSVPGGASLFAGILYRDTNGLVDHVTVENIGAIYGGCGMYLVGHDAAVNVEVGYCNVSAYNKNGITANGDNITANIHHNTVTGMGPTDATAQNGIQIGYGATGAVNNNTVSGHVWTDTYGGTNDPAIDPDADGACGILLYHSTGTVEIAGNTLTANQFGIWTVGAAFINVHGNNITGLAHTGNAFPTAIAVWDSDMWSTGFGYGEVVTGGFINTNTFNSHDYGIIVRDYAAGGALPTPLVTGNTFLNNNIQLTEDTGKLDMQNIWDTNTFDRAVNVDHPGGSLLHTIWSSIQDGIDNAVAGDTVNVGAGTYSEEITVGTANLTLQSESKWGAVIRPSTTPANHGAVIYINADGVTVDGFEIDGTTVCNNGILGWETSGLTIKNNKIHGAVHAWDGCGILLFSWGNSGTVYDNLIENNEVYDTGRMGIMVMDYGGGNYTVTSGNTITGNIVHDTWTVTWDDHGGGIQINVAKNCSITNNVIYDTQNGQRGIYMFGSAAGNTITSNTIRDNPIGIQLWISGEGGTTIDWGGDTPASPAVHLNNIYNNGDGAISTNKEGFPPMVMDATNNWWGAIDGPSASPGSGDKVSDNVHYSPWCAIGDANPATPGYQPPTPMVWGVSTNGTIQEAINAASPGDTINVAAGTYVEAIVINKPLKLRGATWNVNKNGYAVPTGYAWNNTVESIIMHPDPASGYTAIVDIVDVSNVTFAGFIVQELNAVGNSNTSLIRVYAHTHAISNIIVRNNIIGPNTNTTSQDGTHGRMGLYIVNHPYDINGVVNSTFSGNKIFGCEGNGNNVFIWSSYSSTPYNAPGPASMAGTVIADNEIYGAHRSGIETAGGFSDLTIRNNDIYGNGGPGITGKPDLMFGNGIVMIRGSGDRENVDGYGPVNVTLEDNEIYGNDGHGIYMGPNNQGITCTGNNVYNNGQDGITVDLIGNYWNPDFETWTGPYTNLAGSQDVSASFNNIYDNAGLGVRVNGTPTNGFVFDATNNWWNTKDKAVIATKVSDYVDYEPYIGADVTATKSEKTGAGDDTVDAKNEANTTVEKKGTGTPTVTVAKYKDNPGAGFSGDTGSYVDVHLDDIEDVEEITIKLYYTDAEITGVVESSLRLCWWNGTEWIVCSDSGVDTTDVPPYSGYMWAKIRGDTIPNLTQLSGTAFGGGGKTPTAEEGAPPTVGGGGPPGPDRCYLIIDMLGERTMVEIDCCENCTLGETQAYDADEAHLLELQDNTLIQCGDCEGCDCYPSIIVMSPSTETPALPEGFTLVGPIYDFTGYKDTRMQLECSLATYFDPEASVLLGYDPALLPEGAAEPVIGFYSHAEGRWIILPHSPGIVAEVGVANGLASYFASPFAVLASVSAPAPTPEPPPPTPNPANFVASGLNISPTAAKTGETVTINLTVANDGDESGSYTVELAINGDPIDSKVVTLDGGQSELVSFAVSASEAGTYEATVSGLSGSFTVEATSLWWIYLVIAAVVIIGGLLVLRFRKRG